MTISNYIPNFTTVRIYPPTFPPSDLSIEFVNRPNLCNKIIHRNYPPSEFVHRNLSSGMKWNGYHWNVMCYWNVMWYFLRDAGVKNEKLCDILFVMKSSFMCQESPVLCGWKIQFYVAGKSTLWQWNNSEVGHFRGGLAPRLRFFAPDWQGRPRYQYRMNPGLTNYIGRNTNR